jgi:energy-coupling factor transporter ATP-binding protein EcfA2
MSKKLESPSTPTELFGITVPPLNEAPNIDTGYSHGINTTNKDHLQMEKDFLKMEILGGVNMQKTDRLKVTLKTSRNPLLSPLHVYRNTLDLYNSNQIERYIREASENLDIGNQDLKLPIYNLIDSLEKYRTAERKNLLKEQTAPKIILTQQEKTAAMQLLNDKKLLNKIGTLLADIGLVGEEDNGLLLFLIFLTRNFQYPNHPLHAVVHGSSGSGKSNLLKTVISTVPPESKHITTAMTENVLYYPPYKNFWQRKILMLEDLDGSLNAMLSLREFMSNQYVSKLVTNTQAKDGEPKQRILEANGPICIVGATTQEKIYEDNSNRSYIIHVDESKAHQKAVMNHQNKQAAGLINLAEVKTKQNLLQNMQRLLLPINIKNPFQPDLELPESVFKPLRTNQHYIALIKAVTFLHQHQRAIEKDENGQQFITTTLGDIEWANKLCKDSMLRKSDSLTGAQRSFFERLKTQLQQQKTKPTTFFAKDIREAFRMHPQQLKRQLIVLERYHYLTQIGHNKKMGFEYQIENWDDYQGLKDGLNILDAKLQELREKYPDID